MVKETIIEPETIEVKKDDLKKLVDTISRQSKDIETLYQVADRNRLSQLRQSQSEVNLIRTCRVGKWKKNGKLIVAWKLQTNVSEIVAGRWIEDQKVELFFEDGTTDIIQIVDFYRHREPVKVEILGKTSKLNSNSEEEITYKVQLPDGKELMIGQQFIN